MDAELRMELNLRSGLRCRVWHAVGNRQFGLGLAGPLECGVWDVKLKGSCVEGSKARILHWSGLSGGFLQGLLPQV